MFPKRGAPHGKSFIWIDLLFPDFVIAYPKIRQ